MTKEVEILKNNENEYVNNLTKENKDLNSELDEVYKQNEQLTKENNKLKDNEKENIKIINSLEKENNNLKKGEFRVRFRIRRCI